MLNLTHFRLSERTLGITEVPVQAVCRQCGREFEIDEPYFICPSCSSGSVEMISGGELMVESIEVKTVDGKGG